MLKISECFIFHLHHVTVSPEIMRNRLLQGFCFSFLSALRILATARQERARAEVRKR